MAAGSIGGALIGSHAAGEAADKQSAAADRANQLQYDMFRQQRQDQQPFRQAGIGALYGPGGMFQRVGGGSAPAYVDNTAAKDAFIQKRMGELQGQYGSNGPASVLAKMGPVTDKLRAQAEQEWAQSPESQQQIDTSQYQLDPELTRSFGAEDFQADPGYAFRMAEGQKALERSAAARGGLQGGGFAKALTRYNQDQASNEFQNAYNRFNNDKSNRFNRLSAIAGMGQTANNQLGQAGQSYANNAGQNYMGAANAQGAAGIAGANAWNGALSGIGQNWMQANMMSRMFPQKQAFEGAGPLGADAGETLFGRG
jgi:hypothetical protein